MYCPWPTNYHNKIDCVYLYASEYILVEKCKAGWRSVKDRFSKDYKLTTILEVMFKFADLVKNEGKKEMTSNSKSVWGRLLVVISCRSMLPGRQARKFIFSGDVSFH